MKLNALRGISGEFEIGRVLLASSGAAAIVTPIVFQLLDMAHNGWKFDVTAWCVAYPGGLAALAGIGVFSIGQKDKGVATAKATLQASDTAAAQGAV
jgi:hypothetical protein